MARIFQRTFLKSESELLANSKNFFFSKKSDTIIEMPGHHGFITCYSIN